VGIGLTTTFEDLLTQAKDLAASGRRQLLGIAGTPGAGKSTLATRLADQLGPLACLVPMEGFRLSKRALQRTEQPPLPGSPDSYDVDGYVSLLRRIRQQQDPVVWAPAFDRAAGGPVAAAVPVPRDVPLVITEGCYLLVEDSPWAVVGSLLDVVWYLDVEGTDRTERLVRRHVTYGKDPIEARSWVARVDRHHTDLTEPTFWRADRVIRL